jgi:hypothetical protein
MPDICYGPRVTTTAKTKRSVPKVPKRSALRSPFDIGRRGGADRWVLPFVLPLALLPIVGQALHVFGGSAPTVYWVPALIVILGAGLGTLAFLQTHARSALIRVHVGLSVGTAVISLAVHEVIGPFGNSTWTWLWVLIGSAWAISWLVPRFDHVRGDGQDGRESVTPMDEMLGVVGAKVKLIEKTAVRERWRVRLSGGQDFTQLQAAVRKIAALRHVAIGAVRVIGSRTRADEAEVQVVLKDSLSKPTPWPGPSRPGGSIAEPIEVGVYEDGEVERITLTGRSDPKDPLPPAAVGVALGMPGAGKTIFAQLACAEILTRAETAVWWADPIKGRQSLGPIEDGIDWCVETVQQAHQMLDALDRLVKVRANHLGKMGLQIWEPGCGLRWIFCHIEEASRILPDSDSFTQLTQAVRSVGIYLDVSMQRGADTSFNTDARHNLGIIAAFGSGDGHASGWILPDEIADAGVFPEMWRNLTPGLHVLVAPGVERERWAIPARIYLADAEKVRRAVAEAKHLRGPLTAAEQAAAGPLYLKQAKFAGARTEAPAPDAEDLTNDDEEEPNAMPKRPEEIEGIQVNPREGIDVEDVADLTQNGPVYTPLTLAQRRARFAEILRDVLATDPGKPVDIDSMQLTEPWLSTRGITPSQRPALQRLIAALVEKHGAERLAHGRYRIFPGADTLMIGLEAIGDE